MRVAVEVAVNETAPVLETVRLIVKEIVPVKLDVLLANAVNVPVVDGVPTGVAPWLDDGEIVEAEDGVLGPDDVDDEVTDVVNVATAVAVIDTVLLGVNPDDGGKYPASYGGMITPRNKPIGPAVDITLLTLPTVS